MRTLDARRRACLVCAPVRRVAALDSFVAYHPTLEDAILPQVADVQAAIESLHRY